MHVSTNYLFYLPRATRTRVHTHTHSLIFLFLLPQNLPSHQAHTLTTKEANAPSTTVTHAGETLS